MIDRISKYIFVVKTFDKTSDLFFIDEGFSAIFLRPYISKPNPTKHIK